MNIEEKKKRDAIKRSISFIKESTQYNIKVLSSLPVYECIFLKSRYIYLST